MVGSERREATGQPKDPSETIAKIILMTCNGWNSFKALWLAAVRYSIRVS